MALLGGRLQFGPVRGDDRDRADHHDQPDDRADHAENMAERPASSAPETVRVPQRNAREQHVHQPILHLPLVQLLVPAKQHRRIGCDVRFDQIGGIQVRENLDDFRLGRRIVRQLPAADVPGFFDGSRAIEQTDEPVSGIGQAMKLITRRIADDIPAFTAIELAGDLRWTVAGR